MVSYDPHNSYAAVPQTLTGYYSPMMLENIRQALTSIVNAHGPLHIEASFLDQSVTPAVWTFISGLVSLHNGALQWQDFDGTNVQPTTFHQWPVVGVTYANLTTFPNIMSRIRETMHAAFTSIAQLGSTVAQGLTHLGQQTIVAQNNLHSTMSNLTNQAALQITSSGQQSAQLGEQAAQQITSTSQAAALQLSQANQQLINTSQNASAAVTQAHQTAQLQASTAVSQFSQSAQRQLQESSQQAQASLSQTHLQTITAQQQLSNTTAIAQQAMDSFQALILDTKADLTARRTQLDTEARALQNKSRLLAEKNCRELEALALSNEEVEQKRARIDELDLLLKTEQLKLEQEKQLLAEQRTDLDKRSAELAKKEMLQTAAAAAPAPIQPPLPGRFQSSYIPPPPLPRQPPSRFSSMAPSLGNPPSAFNLGLGGAPSALSQSHLQEDSAQAAEIALLKKQIALLQKKQSGDDGSSEADEGGAATDEEDESSCSMALSLGVQRERVLAMEQRHGEPFASLTLSRSTLESDWRRYLRTAGGNVSEGRLEQVDEVIHSILTHQALCRLHMTESASGLVRYAGIKLLREAIMRGYRLKLSLSGKIAHSGYQALKEGAATARHKNRRGKAAFITIAEIVMKTLSNSKFHIQGPAPAAAADSTGAGGGGGAGGSSARRRRSATRR